MPSYLAVPYRLIVDLHIAAGTLALITFWIAGFARKRRGGLHAKSGTAYLMAMRVILGTGLPMALMAFVKRQPATGVFLLFLLVLVASSVSAAPRAIRLKHDFDAFRAGPFRFFAYALPLSAFAVFAYGIAIDAPLLWGFSITGIGVGAGMQRTLRRAEPGPGWWIKAHYSAMIANGVGTHVAFLSIGLSHLLPAGQTGVLQYLPWFGPLTLSVLARTFLDRRHRRRFAPGATGSKSAAPTGGAAVLPSLTAAC